MAETQMPPMLAIIALTTRGVATLSLVGMAFESLGGLYLAYDLLGGEHRGTTSPYRSTFLRQLTRVMTFGLPSIVVMPPLVYQFSSDGAVIALVTILAIPLCGVIAERLVLAPLRHLHLDQWLAQKRAVSPSTVIVAALLDLCAWLARLWLPHSGIILAAVTVIMSLALVMLLIVATPRIEKWIDTAPALRFGYIGVGLLLLGFVAQSFQYIVVMLRIPITN